MWVVTISTKVNPSSAEVVRDLAIKLQEEMSMTEMEKDDVRRLNMGIARLKNINGGPQKTVNEHERKLQGTVPALLNTAFLDLTSYNRASRSRDQQSNHPQLSNRDLSARCLPRAN